MVGGVSPHNRTHQGGGVQGLCPSLLKISMDFPSGKGSDQLDQRPRTMRSAHAREPESEKRGSSSLSTVSHQICLARAVKYLAYGPHCCFGVEKGNQETFHAIGHDFEPVACHFNNGTTSGHRLKKTPAQNKRNGKIKMDVRPRGIR